MSGAEPLREDVIVIGEICAVLNEDEIRVLRLLAETILAEHVERATHETCEDESFDDCSVCQQNKAIR